MPTRSVVLASTALFVALAICGIPVYAQDSNKAAADDDPVVTGTLVSESRETLVVRSDDNQFHLFTYDRSAVHGEKPTPGDRVEVRSGAPDASGAAHATEVAVVSGGSGAENANDASGGSRTEGRTSGQTVHATPPPAPVQNVANEIEGGARRWHAGGRIGVGFSPEQFLFGVQSQIGPIFSPRLLFRPNADFSFGELTDIVSINLEAAYRFNNNLRGGWAPYFGVGPSLNFAHQGFNHSDISFGNFDYKTGFNVLLGAQKRHTFVEMKTSLWSGPVPVLRLIVGYNF